MRPSAVTAEDRFDQREEEVVVVFIIGVYGNRTVLAALEGREPGIVGGDTARLDGEEHIGAMFLDGGDHLLQRGKLRGRRHVKFHLVEAHRALGREQFPAFVHRFFRRAESLKENFRRRFAHAGGEAEQIAQALQHFEEAGVGIRSARPCRFVGLVMGDAGGEAGEGDRVEFVVAMRLPALFRPAHRFLERFQPHAAVQPLVGNGFELRLRDDAERSQRHARGVEKIGIVVRIAFHDVAFDRGKTQGHDIAVYRAQLQSGAVRRGAERAAQRLLVDVGQVRHRPAFGGEFGTKIAKPRSGAHGGDAIRIDIHDTVDLVERQQRAVRRHQRHEGMACAHRADRRGRGLQNLRQLVFGFR